MRITVMLFLALALTACDLNKLEEPAAGTDTDNGIPGDVHAQDTTQTPGLGE